MIELNDIHVYYGDSYILQGVSLNVQAGEIVCLLGRNGAGKTTTMRGIMGYNPPARGRIHFDGQDITGQPVYAIVRQGIGFVPEDRMLKILFSIFVKVVHIGRPFFCFLSQLFQGGTLEFFLRQIIGAEKIPDKSDQHNAGNNSSQVLLPFSRKS